MKAKTTLALDPEIKIMLDGLMLMENASMNAVIAKTVRAFVQAMGKEQRDDLNKYVTFRQAALNRQRVEEVT